MAWNLLCQTAAQFSEGDLAPRLSIGAKLTRLKQRVFEKQFINFANVKFNKNRSFFVYSDHSLSI
jgi:hypothetical protein